MLGATPTRGYLQYCQLNQNLVYSRFLTGDQENLGSRYIPRVRHLVLTALIGITIFQYMGTIKLSDLTREQRAHMLIHDNARYLRLMSDEDIDRLLANLAKRPIKTHTRDHDNLDAISDWWNDRYPERAEARKRY